MVEDTLDGAKSSRYKHAARHLLECLAVAPIIGDFGLFETHEAFTVRLHAAHGRKAGFWSRYAETAGSKPRGPRGWPPRAAVLHGGEDDKDPPYPAR